MMEILAGGLGTALALALILLGLRWIPPAPMDLAAAWNHLSQRTTATPAASWGWRGTLRVLPDRLTDAARRFEHPWLGLPTTDLALLDTTPRAYVRQRLRGAGIGAMAGTLLGLAPLLVGVDLALSLVPLLVLAGLAVGALWPVWRVREAATTTRHDARRALATYLELVAGERASGAAPAPALTQAADLGQHWLFTRLQQTLTYAHRTGHTPWAALRELGTQLQLEALIEVADLADTASEGAAVYGSLTAQAVSLRHHTRSAERAAANAASERLTLPTSLLMLSFLLLVLYPTAAHLLGL